MQFARELRYDISQLNHRCIILRTLVRLPSLLFQVQFHAWRPIQWLGIEYEIFNGAE